jgi:hypothetical protein
VHPLSEQDFGGLLSHVQLSKEQALACRGISFGGCDDSLDSTDTAAVATAALAAAAVLDCAAHSFVVLAAEECVVVDNSAVVDVGVDALLSVGGNSLDFLIDTSVAATSVEDVVIILLSEELVLLLSLLDDMSIDSASADAARLFLPR